MPAKNYLNKWQLNLNSVSHNTKSNECAPFRRDSRIQIADDIRRSCHVWSFMLITPFAYLVPPPPPPPPSSLFLPFLISCKAHFFFTENISLNVPFVSLKASHTKKNKRNLISICKLMDKREKQKTISFFLVNKTNSIRIVSSLFIPIYCF